MNTEAAEGLLKWEDKNGAVPPVTPLGVRPQKLTTLLVKICYFMVALYNRETIYIFMLWFVLSSFFSSPNLSGRRLDVYHTSAHGVVLVMVALCNRADHNIFIL